MPDKQLDLLTPAQAIAALRELPKQSATKYSSWTERTITVSRPARRPKSPADAVEYVYHAAVFRWQGKHWILLNPISTRIKF